MLPLVNVSTETTSKAVFDYTGYSVTLKNTIRVSLTDASAIRKPR